MTEGEWLTETELHPMLRFVEQKATRRQLRLIGAGFCRQIGRFLRFSPGLRTVEVVEAFADGEASSKELKEAEQAVRGVAHGLRLEASMISNLGIYARRDAMEAVVACAGISPALDLVASKARDSIASTPSLNVDQVAVLRCLFGPALFRPDFLEPDWSSRWEMAVSLARSIDEDGAFDRLPYVGDALEEAGCTDADVLDHCRRSGDHYRGCWVIDRLLGREGI